uniref:Acetyltransferase n=1 Tax=Salix viminalis TaxID=40686 RepID=A0A6N2MNX5_SALVM
MNPPTVEHISECFIKPKHLVEEAKKPYYLAPWDLVMLSVQYIQKGLLFAKPPQKENQQGFKIMDFLENLKQSLSLTLVHFYPLAGRLATSKSENPPSYVVFVDCNDSPGARFTYATVDLTTSDVLSPTYVPLVVQSFFDHDRAINHDGHTRSLLTIQVTELIDGIFIGCSINHSIVDGSSYWHFFNMWSEIFQGKGDDFSISRPPVLSRWFPDGHGPVLKSIARLKAKANAEFSTNKISSFQSLSALVWRCITRIRNLPHDQVTCCRLAINNRSRLSPPLSPDYFGNSIQALKAGVSTAGELLEQNLGWAAWQLHQAVVSHGDENAREFLDSWLKSRFIYQIGKLFDPNSVMMGSSPRFNKYGNEFGLGKALALRSGYSHKFSGKASAYPGHEGGGSIDLEICLFP